MKDTGIATPTVNNVSAGKLEEERINMFYQFLSTEIEYIKKFTENHEGKEIIRFYDGRLPDMYTHNFTLIKNSVGKDRFRQIIIEELENRKNENADFLRIECNFAIDDGFIEDLPIAPRVTKYDYMYIEPPMRDQLPNREGCIIRKASSEDTLKDGIAVDILANQSGMGAEFARKRIYRKSEVYQQLQSNLDLYVCYFNDVPVGNCELMLNDGIAKMEDFDILENYQRKGFGTAVVKYLLEEAQRNSVKLVYLITDHRDTAKEMYEKCGFKKIGEKMELFFDLRK